MKINLELLTTSLWTPKDYVDWYAMEMLNQHLLGGKCDVWFIVNITREYVYWMRQTNRSENLTLKRKRLWAEEASSFRIEQNKKNKKIAINFFNKNI